jgi:centriolar protein POC1
MYIFMRSTSADFVYAVVIDKLHYAAVDGTVMTTHTDLSAPGDPGLERTFKGHKAEVSSVSFSPDLRQLVSGSADQCLMLWNLRPQLRAFKFVGHKGPVHGTCFAPSGSIVASASADRTVRLWLPSARGESTVLKGHSGGVRSVGFSRDGRHLITASDDKTVKVWGLPSARFECTLSGHNNWVRCAALSSDASAAVSGGDDKAVILWDVHVHTAVHSFLDHSARVNAVAFSPPTAAATAATIAACSDDRTIKLWDSRAPRALLQHYPAHAAPVTGISFHPSGHYLLSSGADAALKIWDLREGRLLFTLRGHEGPVTACSFSADGDHFASGVVLTVQ